MARFRRLAAAHFPVNRHGVRPPDFNRRHHRRRFGNDRHIVTCIRQIIADQLLVRIGVHQGEVIVTQKDVFGEGVNIAARMESITEPGGMSISKGVYEAIKGKIEAGFQSVGTPPMKNIASPPEVFRVHLQH